MSTNKTNEKTDQVIYEGVATKSQIDEWKKKHIDGFFGIQVKTKNGNYVAYYRYPAIPEINEAIDAISNGTAQHEAYVNLANTTQIGGKEGLLDNRHTYSAVLQKYRNEVDNVTEAAEVVKF